MRMALKQALDKEKTEFQTEFQLKTFQILPTSGTKELISFKPAVVDEWNMCNDRLPEYHCDLLPRIMCIWKNKQKHKFIDKKGTSVVIFGDCCRHIINTYKCWPNFFKFQYMSIIPWVPEVFFRVQRGAFAGAFAGCRPQAEETSGVQKLFARVTIKTWQKPETALEKSLAPRVCPSLPSVTKDDRKQFHCINIVFNNKTGPLLLRCNLLTPQNFT